MSTLTVYFDDPWWVGIIEHEEDQILRVFRQIFGSEPSNEEVLNFVLCEFVRVTSRPVAGLAITPPPTRKISPKRAAREAAQQLQTCALSTKAQQAMQLAQEVHKKEREQISREEKQHIAAYKRQKAREKAYARRRGH